MVAVVGNIDLLLVEEVETGYLKVLQLQSDGPNYSEDQVQSQYTKVRSYDRTGPLLRGSSSQTEIHDKHLLAIRVAKYDHENRRQYFSHFIAQHLQTVTERIRHLIHKKIFTIVTIFCILGKSQAVISLAPISDEGLRAATETTAAIVAAAMRNTAALDNHWKLRRDFFSRQSGSNTSAAKVTAMPARQSGQPG